MEVNNRKKQIVKMLLNKDLELTDESDLIEMLIDNPWSPFLIY